MTAKAGFWRATAILGVAALTAAIVTTVSATPALAGNCTPITTSGPLLSGPSGDTPQPNNDYRDITTVHPYWSIVAADGSQLGTVSVGVLRTPASTCTVIDSTNTSADASRWVALDNNSGRLPIGPYVAQFQGGKCILQFAAGGQTLSTTTPSIDQAVGFGGGGASDHSWIVDIRDVYLTAGMTYTFTVTGGFDGVYLLHSDASDSSTWTARKGTAWAKVELPYIDANTPPGHIAEEYVRTAKLTVQPTTTDWYGVVFSRDTWVGPTVTVRVKAA